MKIVLDTNVLVSGLLSPFGNSAKIVDMILKGDLVLLVDDRILMEYQEVLFRPKFGFSKSLVLGLLDYLRSVGDGVVSSSISCTTQDADDLMFLEVGCSGKADYLITGNIKHFPQKGFAFKIVTPAQFLKHLSL